MKKLLGMLGAVGLIATTSAGAVSCTLEAHGLTFKDGGTYTVKDDGFVTNIKNYSDITEWTSIMGRGEKTGSSFIYYDGNQHRDNEGPIDVVISSDGNLAISLKDGRENDEDKITSTFKYVMENKDNTFTIYYE